MIKNKSEVQKRFEEIIEKKLHQKFISSGDLIRFRDACIEQGKLQAEKEIKEKLEKLKHHYYINSSKKYIGNDFAYDLVILTEGLYKDIKKLEEKK